MHRRMRVQTYVFLGMFIYSFFGIIILVLLFG